MAKSVVLHFRGREAREAKKAKDEQLSLRRGASRVAREVRGFWAKLNKVHTMVCLGVILVCEVEVKHCFFFFSRSSDVV